MPFSRLTAALALVLALLATAASVGGCRHSAPAPGTAEDTAHGKRIGVVATIFPLADLAKKVGGDEVEVTCLLPSGASPHTFEPRPSQAQAVSKAKLFLSIGAGLDDWSAKLAEAGPPGMERLVATRGMDLLPSAKHEHGGGQGDAHKHEGAKDSHEREGAAGDPHIWLDPVLMRDVLAPAICEALAAMDPARADTYRGNLSRYRDELSALDREILDAVARFRDRRMVTFHPAWTYFAHRYGLEQVAVLVESPGKEPSARWLGKVADTMRELGVRVVFAEPQFNPALAEAVAREIGGRALVLDPLGGHAAARHPGPCYPRSR